MLTAGAMAWRQFDLTPNMTMTPVSTPTVTSSIPTPSHPWGYTPPPVTPSVIAMPSAPYSPPTPISPHLHSTHSEVPDWPRLHLHEGLSPINQFHHLSPASLASYLAPRDVLHTHHIHPPPVYTTLTSSVESGIST